MNTRLITVPTTGTGIDEITVACFEGVESEENFEKINTYLNQEKTLNEKGKYCIHNDFDDFLNAESTLTFW